MPENLTIREPKTVVVEIIDLWAIQKSVKYNTFMLDPRNMQPVFPSTAERTNGGVVPVHTAWRLRRKVNALLGRFAAEKLVTALLPLDYDECWYIDNVVSYDAYKTAQAFLLQVFQCIWEHENYLPLQTSVINEQTVGADGKFAYADLVEYLSQAGVSREGWFPKDGEAPADGVS